MANRPQAKKRARQAEARRQINSTHRSKYRTFIKRVESHITAGDAVAADKSYRAAVPVIDSMVNRGLIHKNKAARHKSKLNSKIKTLAGV